MTGISSYEDLEQRIRDLEEQSIKRLQTETVLKETLQRLNFHIENTPLAVVEFNHRFEISYWSRQAEAIFGWKAEEVLGKAIKQLRWVHEDDAKGVAELFADMIAARRTSGMHTNRSYRKDGSVILCEWRSSVLFNAKGEFNSVLSMALDVTKRREAEAKLQATSAKLEAALASMNGALFISDLEGHFIDFNEAFATFHRFRNKKECVGKLAEYPAFLEIYNADGELLPLDQWAVPRALRGEKGTNIERRLRRKDTGETWIGSYCFAPIRDKEGSITGAVVVAHDITERKEMEERLKRLETMEMLGKIAGGVAHDLNNVLGVMVGLSELLMCQVEADPPLRKSLQTIMESGQRGAAIVQDLLTMTRRGVVVRKPLNLNDIVSSYLETAEYAQLAALHRGVHLQTDLESALMNISGSNIHLQKMVMNLVLNAMEATPEGGALTIKTENCYLEAPIKGYEEIGKGEYAVLSLSDTGEGIPFKNLPHIFEPFYTTRQMQRNGSGLGLSVVWGIVKEHDGYIDVQSLTGEGTTLKLYFPITREELPQPIEERRRTGYRGTGQSILAVDDEKGQRELAVMLLSLLNYRVTAVSSGEEAVEYLKFHQADLVILDMIMESGMDGLDTYREIVKIHPHQKALIVSGFSETERTREAQELGAGAFVKKPYSMEGLGLEVKRELNRK